MCDTDNNDILNLNNELNDNISYKNNNFINLIIDKIIFSYIYLSHPLNIYSSSFKHHPIEYKYPFLCRVTCSCKHSIHFPNILSYTGCLFIIPAFLLVTLGKDIYAVNLGISSCILTISTIIYHYTHHPYFRAFDIISMYIMVFFSFLCVINWWNTGFNNILLLLSLITPIVCFLIFILPSTNIKDEDGYNIIKLKYHILTHILVFSGGMFLFLHNYFFINKIII